MYTTMLEADLRNYNYVDAGVGWYTIMSVVAIAIVHKREGEYTSR